MYKSRRAFSSKEALAEERRRYIADRAFKVFAQVGYSRATMRQVYKACKMTSGGVYHYVGSKEHILRLIFHYKLSEGIRHFESLIAESERMDATEAIRTFIQMALKRVDDTQDFVLFVYRESGNLGKAVLKNLLEYDIAIITACEKLLQRGVAAGQFEIDDVNLVAQNMWHLCQMWGTRHWYLKQRYSLEEFTRKQTDFVLKKIVKASG